MRTRTSTLFSIVLTLKLITAYRKSRLRTRKRAVCAETFWDMGWFLFLFSFVLSTLSTLPPGWEKNITKIHLVYMTHLDIGYTRVNVSEVLDQYIHQWFPKAF